MVSPDSRSMLTCVIVSVLAVSCSIQTRGSVSELSNERNTRVALSMPEARVTPKKRTRRCSVAGTLGRLTKRVYPKRLLGAAKETFLYSVLYPCLEKYYEIREDGLQRSDYFNIVRKLFYLYLAKKCYDAWQCRSTIFYLLVGYAGKFGIDHIEQRTNTSQADKDGNQQHYVNKMLSFLSEEQKQRVSHDKELFGSVSVAQEFNDPRLLKENHTFYTLLNNEQTEYLDTIIFEYMSHHNLLRSYLTRRKEEAQKEEKLDLYDFEKRYCAFQSQLPWADAIDEQIDYTELEALAAQTDDPDFWSNVGQILP